MPNQLQTARYDGLVRRVGGLLGGGSKVTESLSELFPIMDMENLPAELLFLAGWTIGMNTSTPNGVAAQFSKAQVFNPVGSGKIAVVTSVDITGTASQFDWQINETPFAALFPGITRDTHAGFTRPTALVTGAQNDVARTVTAGTFNTQANVTFRFISENGICVLRPGSGIEFGASIANTSFRVTFLWRERAALTSELNFP